MLLRPHGGQSNIASGTFSTSWGAGNKTKGEHSTAWGAVNELRGVLSSVWGLGNIGKSYLETVFGQHNDTLTSTGPDVFVGTDYVFVIGNGTDINNRSNAVEIYKNGNMRVGCALSLKNSSETISADDQLISVDNRSFIKVASNSPTATSRTILLSNGLLTGQILYIENSGIVTTAFELQDSGNTDLTGTHVFTTKDVIQLIWDGNIWLEVHFSKN